MFLVFSIVLAVLAVVCHSNNTIDENGLLVIEKDTTIITAEDGYTQDASLVTVVIPSSVVTIGKQAFFGCQALKNVTFVNPNGALTTIGDYAFGNTAIVSIKLTSQLKTIGSNAFYQNDYLELVEFAQGSGDFTSIGDYAFAESSIANFSLPASTQSIGIGFFSNTANLIDFVFVENSGEDVNAPGLTEIGEEAFMMSGLIGPLEIPNTLNTLGKKAFFGCASLKILQFKPTSILEVISDSAFSQTGLTNVMIPNSVKKIDINAFTGLDGNTTHSGTSPLKTVAFEQGSQLTSIGSQAFQNNGKLEIMNIPASVETIHANAFSETRSLSKVTFQSPSALSSIESSAFMHSGLIGELELPNNIVSIGSNSFSFNLKLTKVVFDCGSSVTINSDAFSQTGVTSMILPMGSICNDCIDDQRVIRYACQPTFSPTRAADKDAPTMHPTPIFTPPPGDAPTNGKEDNEGSGKGSPDDGDGSSSPTGAIVGIFFG